jgi:hypothetical protein
MAIILEANYSKKLGLPGYSSHQYSVTVRTEISDANLIHSESDRLYDLLQSCVDTQITKTGFLPEQGQIKPPSTSQGNGNGTWACSPKQKDLILDIVQEHGLETKDIDQLADDRFGKAVMQLNKLEASGLIDELLERYGKGNGNNRRYSNGRYSRSGGRQ